MRYAVVKNGRVCNVILWDGESEYTPEAGTELLPAPDDVTIGWLRSGSQWVAPEPAPVQVPPDEDPSVVQAKQTARDALMALGISEGDACTIVGLSAGT